MLPQFHAVSSHEAMVSAQRTKCNGTQYCIRYGAVISKFTHHGKLAESKKQTRVAKLPNLQDLDELKAMIEKKRQQIAELEAKIEVLHRKQR